MTRILNGKAPVMSILASLLLGCSGSEQSPAAPAPDGEDIEYLEERKSEDGWSNVEVRRSARDEPTLTSASVDAVVTLNTWRHVTERAAFAGRIHAGLRSGGRRWDARLASRPNPGAVA